MREYKAYKSIERRFGEDKSRDVTRAAKDLACALAEEILEREVRHGIKYKTERLDGYSTVMVDTVEVHVFIGSPEEFYADLKRAQDAGEMAGRYGWLPPMQAKMDDGKSPPVSMKAIDTIVVKCPFCGRPHTTQSPPWAQEKVGG